MSAYWRESPPLVLASGSAARRMLLESAAIPLEIIKPQVDEAPLAQALVTQGARPQDIASALALAKGEAVSRSHPARIVLAADQTLEFEGRLGMKPASPAMARDQLMAMRAKLHHLHSSAVLLKDGKPLWQGSASASLEMRDFSDEFLSTYLAAMGARVMDTVGGYELEALGVHLFSRIEGEHATVLGLPLVQVLAALRAQGALMS